MSQFERERETKRFRGSRSREIRRVTDTTEIVKKKNIYIPKKKKEKAKGEIHKRTICYTHTHKEIFFFFNRRNTLTELDEREKKN